MKIFKFLTIIMIAACLMTLPDGAEAARRKHGFAIPFPVTASTDVKYIEAECTVDGDFEVALDANPTAGFMWSLYQGLPSGLSLVSERFVPGAPPEDAADGQPGVDHFVFHAYATGENHIVLKYERPGGKEPPAYAVVTVSVKLK